MFLNIFFTAKCGNFILDFCTFRLKAPSIKLKQTSLNSGKVLPKPTARRSFENNLPDVSRLYLLFIFRTNPVFLKRNERICFRFFVYLVNSRRQPLKRLLFSPSPFFYNSKNLNCIRALSFLNSHVSNSRRLLLRCYFFYFV